MLIQNTIASRLLWVFLFWIPLQKWNISVEYKGSSMFSKVRHEQKHECDVAFWRDTSEFAWRAPFYSTQREEVDRKQFLRSYVVSIETCDPLLNSGKHSSFPMKFEWSSNLFRSRDTNATRCFWLNTVFHIVFDSFVVLLFTTPSMLNVRSYISFFNEIEDYKELSHSLKRNVSHCLAFA